MKEVFLGGTCGTSTWREQLIPQLKIDFFNPVVPDWTDEAYKLELLKRETCDYCLYVLTPETPGTYSIAEVVDDSNKRPEKTVLCVLDNQNGRSFAPHEVKAFDKIATMVKNNGGRAWHSLELVAEYLNNY